MSVSQKLKAFLGRDNPFKLLHGSKLDLFSSPTISGTRCFFYTAIKGASTETFRNKMADNSGNYSRIKDLQHNDSRIKLFL